MSFDPDDYLQALAALPDDEIDVAPAALALAAKQQTGIHLERYTHHLKTLVEDVGDEYQALLKNGEEESAETQLAALKEVLHVQQGYNGDDQTYDDLQNANLIRVIERQKGLPISLCILYIHAAKGLGWDVAGLNVPGHFLCRIEKDGVRLIFDPFQACKILEAPDLRLLVKKANGPHAELSSQYYDPCSSRDILIRLQNNIKFRQIEGEDYDGALQTVELMRLIDPEEYRLLLDAGVLYARTEQPMAAIETLQKYLDRAPNDRDRQEAALLLQDLKASLN